MSPRPLSRFRACPAADQPDAHAQLIDAAARHSATDLLPGKRIGPTDAEKIANAEKMFGTNSKQHLAAKKKFGKAAHEGKTSPVGPTSAEKIANAATMFGTGSRQHREAQRRFGGES
jgi:hypothetical protein